MSDREDTGLWRRLTTDARPIEKAGLLVAVIAATATIYATFFAGSSSVTATNGGVAIGGSVSGTTITTGGGK